MNWFWTTKEKISSEKSDLEASILENEKAVNRKIRANRRLEKSSSDLLRLTEKALEILEGKDTQDEKDT